MNPPTDPKPSDWPVGHEVAGELPCSKCGYLLTGLPAAGRCPECGEAILRALVIIPEPAATAAAMRGVARARVVSALAWIPFPFMLSRVEEAVAPFIGLAAAGAVLLLGPLYRLRSHCGLADLPGRVGDVKSVFVLLVIELLLYAGAAGSWANETWLRPPWRQVDYDMPNQLVVMAVFFAALRACSLTLFCAALATRCRLRTLASEFYGLLAGFFVTGAVMLIGLTLARRAQGYSHTILVVCGLPFAVIVCWHVRNMFRLAEAVGTAPTHRREETVPMTRWTH